MPKQLLVNLPVHDLEASKQFFAALGLPLNEKLTDEHATCFTIEDNIIVALLPVEHFKETILGSNVADATTHETLLAIGMERRTDVSDLLDKALAAGATEVHDRVDLSEIYAGTFKDLDGHLWNVFCMN